MHCRIPALGAVLLLGLIALCGLSTAARAQGILYPRPDVRIQPFYVKNLRVNAVVHDAVAETRRAASTRASCAAAAILRCWSTWIAIWYESASFPSRRRASA